VKALVLITLLLMSGESDGRINTAPDFSVRSWNQGPDYNQQSNHAGDSSVSVESDSPISVEADTIIQIQREVEVAANAANLNLHYCTQGASSGTVRLTFAFGSLDFTCKVANAIPQQLSMIAPLLAQAERETEPLRKQALIREARLMMDNIYAEGHMLADHIKWSSVFSKIWDVTKVVGMLVVIGMAL